MLVTRCRKSVNLTVTFSRSWSSPEKRFMSWKVIKKLHTYLKCSFYVFWVIKIEREKLIWLFFGVHRIHLKSAFFNHLLVYLLLFSSQCTTSSNVTVRFLTYLTLFSVYIARDVGRGMCSTVCGHHVLGLKQPAFVEQSCSESLHIWQY